MYVLCLANTNSQRAELPRIVTQVSISDDPAKIEVALKMLSGLLRLVHHDEVRGITDALSDLAVRYCVLVSHIRAGATGRPMSVRRPSPESLADHFVRYSADDFVRWLRMETRKPRERHLSVVV